MRLFLFAVAELSTDEIVEHERPCAAFSTLPFFTAVSSDFFFCGFPYSCWEATVGRLERSGQ